jgi:glycosyltransferase involved in cell wall biosynthesis
MRFKPTAPYRHFLRYHGRSLDQVPQEELDSIRQKIENRFTPAEPTASVVIIVHNEEKYLLATLASLADMEPACATELLFVNNRSTDATQDILDRVGVRNIYQPEKGIPKTRRAGLENARGSYLLTGDADTIYKRHWVDHLVKPLEDPAITCTYSMYVFYQENGRYPFMHYFYHLGKYLAMQLQAWKRAHLNAMGGGMAFRRQDALELGGYDPEMKRGSDGNLAWRLSQRGKVVFVDKAAADVISNMRRAFADGSMSKALWKRVRKLLGRFSHYFSAQSKT